MRVLVTGGSGRIGTVLIEALNERHEVIAYDRKKPERLPQGVVFAPGDILDREALRAALDGVEAVVHLAGIPYDIPPLHEVFAINVQGTYNALELAVESGVEYFLHASSIMAYGFGQNADPLYLPIDEAHPLRANRPYGLSKVVGEELCRTFAERCGLKTFAFRLTNAVVDSEDANRFPMANKQMEVAMHQYFFVRDFAELIESVFRAEQLEHEIFLVSALDSTHVDTTEEVIMRYYPQTELRYESLGPYSPFVSMEKARSLLGFVPRYSWRDFFGPDPVCTGEV